MSLKRPKIVASSKASVDTIEIQFDLQPSGLRRARIYRITYPTNALNYFFSLIFVKNSPAVPLGSWSSNSLDFLRYLFRY